MESSQFSPHLMTVHSARAQDSSWMKTMLAIIRFAFEDDEHSIMYLIEYMMIIIKNKLSDIYLWIVSMYLTQPNWL